MRYESTPLAPKEYFQRSISSSIYGTDNGENGASSSSEKSDFVLVEYPGVVKNIDKALRTLGGIPAIAAV